MRAFFIHFEHPAGGNGPSGAGFAATCRHGTTEWPRLSRRMRERPAPRSQAGNDATSDTLTTQDSDKKRRSDKLRRNARKNGSRVSCPGGFAQAHTHTGSAILPSVNDVRLHSRGFHPRGGRGRWGRWGETHPTTPGSGNRFAVRLASAAIRAALFLLSSRLEAATIRPARSGPISMTGGPRPRGTTPHRTTHTRRPVGPRSRHTRHDAKL